MIKYFLKRISCSVVAVLLAFSIVILVVSSLFVAFFAGEGFIADKIDENKTEIINDINEEVKPLAQVTGINENAFVNAINEDNFRFISETVAKNLMYSYRTDFSDSHELYSIYYSSISEQLKKDGKKINSKDHSKYASLAVYTASKVINANDTARVYFFYTVHSKKYVLFVIGSLVLTILSIAGIELINKGRHRKFSYMGMGIISSGYILFFGTLFVKKADYVNKNIFLEFEPYNKAVQTAINDTVSRLIFFGIVFIIIGLIMLIVNYNYFRKKNEKALAEKEFNKKLVTDFLEYDEPTVSHRLGDGEGFEKEITKIDFD